MRSRRGSALQNLTGAGTRARTVSLGACCASSTEVPSQIWGCHSPPRSAACSFQKWAAWPGRLVSTWNTWPLLVAASRMTRKARRRKSLGMSGWKRSLMLATKTIRGRVHLRGSSRRLSMVCTVSGVWEYPLTPIRCEPGVEGVHVAVIATRGDPGAAGGDVPGAVGPLDAGLPAGGAFRGDRSGGPCRRHGCCSLRL